MPNDAAIKTGMAIYWRGITCVVVESSYGEVSLSPAGCVNFWVFPLSYIRDYQHHVLPSGDLVTPLEVYTRNA